MFFDPLNSRIERIGLCRLKIRIAVEPADKRELMKRDADAAQIKAVENQITERMKVFNMVVRNLREKQPA